MSLAQEFYLRPGDEVTLEREVTEAAVNGFADISGDHSPNHTDEGSMSRRISTIGLKTLRTGTKVIGLSLPDDFLGDLRALISTCSTSR